MERENMEPLTSHAAKHHVTCARPSNPEMPCMKLLMFRNRAIIRMFHEGDLWRLDGSDNS